MVKFRNTSRVNKAWSLTISL